MSPSGHLPYVVVTHTLSDLRQLHRRQITPRLLREARNPGTVRVWGPDLGQAPGWHLLSLWPRRVEP